MPPLDWTRRDVLGATAGTLGAHLLVTEGVSGVEAAARAEDSEPTSLSRAAELAKEVGDGKPLTFVDLAAVDNNIEQIVTEIEKRGWALRPSLKSFQSPEFSAYVLSKLPEPRGMIFHLRSLRQLLPALPENPDLMLGYAPTVGELETYFTQSDEDEPPHRFRLMIDSPELLDICADLAKSGQRELPVEVALEFDSGLQRGGIKNESELSEAIDILRENQDSLRLTGAMCYDGHATIDSNPKLRQVIAEDAQRRYRAFMSQLREEGGDLFDESDFVRNGPGSSNYQNWDSDGVVTEVSPGTAFVFHGYLTDDGHDNEGLEPTLLHGAPVMRLPADGPRTPLVGVEPPWAALDDVPTEKLPFGEAPSETDGFEEVLLKGGAWPSNTGDLAEMVHPDGMEDDPTSGGRGNNKSAVLGPRGEFELGDYVLLRPQNAGDGIEYFGALHAIREGELEAIWPTINRWQTPTEQDSSDGRSPGVRPPENPGRRNE